MRCRQARPSRQEEDFAKTYQLAFTEPILGRLQVPPEHKGPKSEAFRVMVVILKNKFRSNVPAISDALQRRVVDAIASEVAPSDGKCSLWRQHPGIGSTCSRSCTMLGQQASSTRSKMNGSECDSCQRCCASSLG